MSSQQSLSSGTWPFKRSWVQVPMLWPATPPTGSPGSPRRGLTSASRAGPGQRPPPSCPLQDQLRFPRMLMKLVSLRTLSSVHSEQVFALRLQDKKLPPLLSEIWDVHE